MLSQNGGYKSNKPMWGSKPNLGWETSTLTTKLHADIEDATGILDTGAFNTISTVSQEVTLFLGVYELQ